MNYEQLQRLYAGDGYYWGRKHNEFAARTLEFLPRAPEGDKLRAVDVGAGEGRDAVLFAERGLDTLAVDVAPNGLKKAARLARERGVDLRVEQGDVNALRLVRPFDLVYSIGALQYLMPANRGERFDHFQRQTNPGGLHALFTFVDHPDLPPAPDWGTNEHAYAPGELLGYYAGWRCLYSRGFTFEDDSGGTIHLHAAEEYIFEKPR